MSLQDKYWVEMGKVHNSCIQITFLVKSERRDSQTQGFGSSLIQVNQLYIDKLIIDRQFRSISLMMSYAMA